MELEQELLVVGVDHGNDPEWSARLLLVERHGCRLIRRAFTMDGLFDVVETIRPDVVVLGLDSRLPDRQSLTELGRVLSAWPMVRFVLMSSEPTDSVSVFTWWAAIERRGVNALVVRKDGDAESEARGLAEALRQIRDELVDRA